MHRFIWGRLYEKKLCHIFIALVAISILTSVPAYAARRVVIDRKNYNSQQNRENGCWLTMSRNFVVAQQPDRSAQSDSTVRSQYDEVCKKVLGTTADDTSRSAQDVLMALEEFDKMLGTGSYHGHYDFKNGHNEIDFNFIFKEITNDGDPVGITLGPVKGDVAHDVLITGADNGTNLQEVVRILDDGSIVWAQYYDLVNKSIPGYCGRSWSGTTWCK